LIISEVYERKTFKKMTSKVSFDVPAGAAAKVHIVDSGWRLSGMPTAFLVTPPVEGFNEFPPLASWCFLIESSTGRKVLFDLGGPANAAALPPPVTDSIEKVGVRVEVGKHIADMLAENGIEPANIESVIWR
jgi:hypothetical protein